MYGGLAFLSSNVNNLTLCLSLKFTYPKNIENIFIHANFDISLIIF